MQNSAFYEEAYPLKEGERIAIPKSCNGWTLIGIHAWNNERPKNQCSVYNVYSNIRVATKKTEVIKGSSMIRLFNTLNTPLLLDDESFCEFSQSPCSEPGEGVILTPHSYMIPYFNLIDFFLVKEGKWNDEIPFNCANVIVESEYDFNFLVPNVKVIKEIIEEYCAAKGLTNAPPPKTIIKEIPIPAIYLIKAKDRIHNHLAYKLGSAMILNSKSLWGYIRMPYVLSYIKESHKQEQRKYQDKIKKNPKLKLPKLESYQDYKEALKEKECLTYKLGEALIRANRDWYKGGYLRFYFQEVPKLKRAFKGKKV